MKDEYQFILTFRIMWTEQDVEVTVPIIKATWENFPEISRCRFDKGFHNPDNQKQFQGLILYVVLSKKGK